MYCVLDIIRNTNWNIIIIWTDKIVYEWKTEKFWTEFKILIIYGITEAYKGTYVYYVSCETFSQYIVLQMFWVHNLISDILSYPATNGIIIKQIIFMELWGYYGI